jgi:hypothetical protein
MINDQEDLGHWVRVENIETFGDESKEYFGFVYRITLPSGYWYIGSKQLQSKRKLKPLKGNVNARRKVVESDWKDYTSSSNLINDYISKKSKIGMLFEIITLTKGGKFELKYCEMKHQVLNNCLFDEKCLNGIINVRLGKNKKISLDKIL